MNFIFIVSDSFRFDNLACYTGKRPRFRTKLREVETPNLDRLASISTVFDHAYLGSYPTVPNRKDVFTGTMHKFNTWAPLGDNDRTFFAELVKAGYVTQMITDTPHTVKGNFNFARDFDGWEWIRGQEGDRLNCYTKTIPSDPRKSRPPHAPHGGWAQHLGNLDVLGRRYEDECFCAKTMKTGVQWLERQYTRTTPFCLYLDTFDPHEPWDAPAWYEDFYDPNYSGDGSRYPIYGNSAIYTKAELNHLRALYAAEVTLVDRWIGHLLDSVERMGLLENTCIVFTADHGFMLGEHDWTGKIVPPLYEEMSHIPMLIHMPGQKKERHASAMAQPVDYAPTILDLAGVKSDLPTHGHSLKPSLEGKSQNIRPYAFSRGDARGLVASSQEWSLVYPNPDGLDPKKIAPELFNLVSDPLQKKNVLKQNRQQAQAMWDAYAKWWKAMGGEVNTQTCPRP